MKRDEELRLFEQPSLALDLPEPSVTALSLPEGFSYQRNVISASKEQKLMEQFAALPLKPFEFRGFLGNRRVVSYGYRYDYSARSLGESAPIPGVLQDMRQLAAQVAELDPEEFQQALVSEYAAGAGIGWHKDKPMFRDVVAFSFGSSCVLRLRRKSGASWERWKLIVEPRSAYLLRGPARWEWEHSIPPVDALRYSLTFRNFVGE
jgi:alkylated DNA repair dioxygenase AlkB